MSDETPDRCEYLPGTIGAESHCSHWHAAGDPGFARDPASAECCWCGDHEDGSGSCPGPTQGDTDYLLHRLRVARATVPKDGPTDRILAQAHDELERLHALTEGDPTSIYAEAADLRAWKESATTVLAEWDRVFDALGQPGPLGGSKAANALTEVERRTAENERLRAERDDLAQGDAVVMENAALRSENERLREALRQMVAAVEDAARGGWERQIKEDRLDEVTASYIDAASQELGFDVGALVAAASLSETGGEGT